MAVNPLIFSQTKVVPTKQETQNPVCNKIICEPGTTFIYDKIPYTVSRVIKGGSNSIKVIELENMLTREKTILKIKFWFDELEVRNYMKLGKFLTLIPIQVVINAGYIYSYVYGLHQKLVPGQKLSRAIASQTDQAKKDIIIASAIRALCNLHCKYLAHGDALPDNCNWDVEKQRAEFVDYDIMRTKNELGEAHFKRAIIEDFKRLLLGCITRTNSHIKGLSYYTPNITNIIRNIPDNLMDPNLKTRILKDIEIGHKLAGEDRARHLLRKYRIA